MNNNEILQTREPASAPTQGQANPSNRILVVDDDISIRELSTEVLIPSGYQVDTAENGAAGWDALHAKRYDLLITDNNMPKVSGVELVKKLRRARMTLPVVLASSTIPTEELNRNPSLQLAATLLKPFTIDELLVTVKQVLRAAEGQHNHREESAYMEVEIAKEILTVGGFAELTAANSNLFRKKVCAALNGHTVVEIDLSQTTFMDAAGLGALIAVHNLTRRRNGVVRLVNPTSPVQQLLNLVRAGNLFEIVNTCRPTDPWFANESQRDCGRKSPGLRGTSYPGRCARR